MRWPAGAAAFIASKWWHSDWAGELCELLEPTEFGLFRIRRVRDGATAEASYFEDAELSPLAAGLLRIARGKR